MNIKKKKFINLLIYRWDQLKVHSAMEQCALSQHTLGTRYEMPEYLTLMMNAARPTEQINIFKREILQILPGMNFILHPFSPPANIIPDDFIELCAEHESICIDKVRHAIGV